MSLNVLSYTRKAAAILDDLAEWGLSAYDGKIAKLSARDIREAQQAVSKAKRFIEKAEADLSTRKPTR